MAEAVGGAILSALIQVLVERLASLGVTNFFRSNGRVGNMLEVKLRSANSLLNDAEDKQVKDDCVKKWVDDLNQVLNDAGDVIDRVNTKVLCREIEGKRLCVPISLDPFDQWAMKGKLEAITGRLELLLGEAENLGLRADVPSKKLLRSPAPLIEDPCHVYGRDGDKEAIVKLLCSENVGGQDKISVIPIVGMGGVGKTTLARLVYHDSRVKHRFEHRAWVTVTDDFNVLNLEKHTLVGLRGEKHKVTELDELGEELKRFLSGKKFFLVLDDVWNDNYSRWNSLQSYFQVGADGSKIIVTTRSEEIGSKMASVSSHFLRPMEDEDCWKLFQKHVFHSVEECTKQLETIGMEIVRKCKGLPLAVISLASLLRSVSDPKEWEKVEKSDVWEIERKGDHEILPSLWLNYSYLPSNVKRCFAYCSIFPKDYEYDSEKIIPLWMAEGIVRGEIMENVGEEYFKTLVSRSLLQRSSGKDTSNFRMHDLVHDLATFVSGKGFCLRLGKGDGFDRLTSKTRHLLCHSYRGDSKGLSTASSLRTFITTSYMSDRVLHEIPKKFPCLRVLCQSSDIVDNVSESIGKLKHLRYLDLSGTLIEKLPSSICKLYNLQTLLMRGCWKLTHLPAKMDNLVNLRHLDISETWSLKEIPLNVYKLKALQTVTKFILGSENRITELKKFPHSGGCLDICGLENIVDTNDMLEVEFKEKSLITKLVLEWYNNSEECDETKDRAILDAFRPHPNLKKLSIKGYGGIEFSDWVADRSFSDLVEVSLEHCSHCINFPPLGQLPCLKEFRVNGLPRVKTIVSEGSSGATPFPSLEILSVHYMDELQSCSFGAEGAFPCLKKLAFWDCAMLTTVCLDPIHCLPSLTTLNVGHCPKLQFSGFPLPSSLKELSIRNCDMLYSQRMQWRLEALTDFAIYECSNADSFPEEGLLPTTLTYLEINDIPNLKSLNGKAFQCLTSLRNLQISKCPKLLSLPEEKLPASIEYFDVDNCPILESRLRRETGEDWHKISHIPITMVDYEFV